MNIIIELSDESNRVEKNYDTNSMEKYIKDIISDEYSSEKDIYLSLLLTTNEAIREINREYREKDYATDVISFAYLETEADMGPFISLGDIVISIDKIEEQAKEYNHSFERELYFCLTHGILHLLGYDHIEEEDRVVMRKKEEEILNKYGFKF